MSELKPCPFCGGEGEKRCWFPNRYFFISCKSCGASIRINATKEKAIVAWNNRVNRCQDCLVDRMIDDGR